MKLATAAALVVSPLLSTPLAAQTGKIDLCDYKPVMMEDFSDFRVSPWALGAGRWIAHTPWNGDFGDAAFSNPTPGGPFFVKDGELQIVARKDPSGKWRSGLISAGDPSGAGTGAQYGYFEARMKFPPGPGTWPAFWIVTQKPAKDLSPGVEIDVVEYYGHSTGAYSSALHVWYKDDKAKSRHVTHRTAVPNGSLVGGYHDYGVRVATDAITYYLDGEPVWSQPTPPEHAKPLFPIVNLALGSGFPIDRTPDPSVLSVKSVHVYAFDPSGRSARCAK